jgi:hypothetical protein
MATLKPVHSVNPDQPLVEKGQNSQGARLLVENMKRVADRTGGVMFQWMESPNYTVTQLQAITTAPVGAGAYCTDETGGEVPVFFASDGNWRRVTDRAVIS